MQKHCIEEHIEYLLDIFLYGSLEERKALVVEQRKEVLKLEQRIAELSADRTMPVEEIRNSLSRARKVRFIILPQIISVFCNMIHF